MDARAGRGASRLPRARARAPGSLARFERDLEAWLRTPAGRFAVFTAARAAEPAGAERR